MTVTRIGIAALYLYFCTGASAQVADSVYVNGNIYTANERAPCASAIAVAGDRILFIGENEGLDQYMGDSTRTIDLAGRFVLPGLIDAHTHPGMVALSVGQVELGAASDKESLLREVAQMLALQAPTLECKSAITARTWRADRMRRLPALAVSALNWMHS